EAATNYTMRGRYRDNSGVGVSEYSYWSTRNIRTAPPSAVFPYTEIDIRKYPLPNWTLDAGGAVALPVGGSLTLGSAQNELLARLDGGASGNVVTNPSALAAAVPVRVSVSAGADALALGASTLRYQDDSCVTHTIYLPAIDLAAGETAYYWVDTSGSTYVGQGTDTDPVFTTLARGTVTPWAVRQPGYVVETFATGFQLPVNIAFVPNPGPNPSDILCYVTELYGQVMMVTRDGTVGVYASNLLNYPPTGVFPGSGECGVAGIVVEPGTGDLFVDMLYAVTPGDPSNLRPKIVRMHSTDGGRTMATQTTIITFPSEQQGQSHQISNLSIGPDGKLYVHMGDGMDATRGQTITSDRGKILRMNFDGTPPADNPFYASAPGVTGTPTVATQLIWLYGVRNPFGGAWRASDGQHYSIENGPSNDRISMCVAGRNYLYNGTDSSMANYNILGVSTSPLVSAWYPAHGPVNIAFAQTATFGGSGFPADKMDHMFASESGPTYATGPQTLGKRISELVVAPSTGALISGPVPLVEYIGSGQASCVGLAFGPDGLYFTDLYKDASMTPSERGANLLRIRYVGSSGPCPACPADFNASGGLDVQDIFDFLNAWFAGDPRADFNGLGGTSVQDIFDFLNAWFAGC
ncbi:MAG TPA: PQQ-dependent sugar dehydrogenase, partial [Phycisphaerales bacterium]|nr:PQQ-dependent sugar dehydrogenase [Phycisphaerales bacterium]